MLQVRVCMSQLNIEDFVLQLTWHSQIKKKKKRTVINRISAFGVAHVAYRGHPEDWGNFLTGLYRVAQAICWLRGPNQSHLP